MSSNLPPGVTGTISPTEIACHCVVGHRWLAPGFTELGGAFFADEDHGDVCPVCRRLDVASYGSESGALMHAEDFGDPLPGYVHDVERNVWLILSPCELCGATGEHRAGCPDDDEPVLGG